MCVYVCVLVYVCVCVSVCAVISQLQVAVKCACSNDRGILNRAAEQDRCTCAWGRNVYLFFLLRCSFAVRAAQGRRGGKSDQGRWVRVSQHEPRAELLYGGDSGVPRSHRLISVMKAITFVE